MPVKGFLKFSIVMGGNHLSNIFKKLPFHIGKKDRILSCLSMEFSWDQIGFAEQIKHTFSAQFQKKGTYIPVLVSVKEYLQKVVRILIHQHMFIIQILVKHFTKSS